MKANVFRVLRSGLCLLLTLCMTAGMCPVQAFAAETEKETFNYASFGDSMTNGYGLSGYGDEDNGYYSYGKASYAEQLTQELSKTYQVHHDKLAMSAMRTEDLNFILRYPRANSGAQAVAQAMPEDDGYSEATHGANYMQQWWVDVQRAKWEATFGASVGDFYTWSEFTSTRFQKNTEGTANAAKVYQEAVAKADLISIGSGNANFGVFILNRIMDQMGVMGGNPDMNIWMNWEDTLVTLDPQYQMLLREMEKMLKSEIAKSDLSEIISDELVNVFMYGIVSLAVSYEDALDAIIELNQKENLDIIQMGLMNTMTGVDLIIDGQAFPLGETVDSIIAYMNNYLAALPTIKQSKGIYPASVHFYWAENTFYKDPDPNRFMNVATFNALINGDNVMRGRFITEIMGTQEIPGLLWGYLGYDQAENFATRKQIETFYAAYNSENPADMAAYIKNSGILSEDSATAESAATSISSIVQYKGFEDAILKSTETNIPLDVNALLALTDPEAFAGILNPFMETLEPLMNPESDKEIKPSVQEVLDATVDRSAAVMAELSDGALTVEEVKSLVTGGEDGIYALVAAKSGGALSAEVVKSIYESKSVPEIVESIDALKTVCTGFDVLNNMLAMPVILRNELVADTTVYTLLNMFARSLIGNGIGCHPSEAGHDNLYAAVKLAYFGDEEGNKGTSADKTEQSIKDAMDKLYSWTVKNMPQTIEESKKWLEENRDKFNDQVYLRNTESYYVGLGDSSAIGSRSYSSYINGLAADLDLGKGEYISYAAEKNTIVKQLKELDTNKALQADIAKADLVTIGFSNVSFMSDTINTLVSQFMGGKPAAPDWSEFADEENMKYVETIRNEIFESLTTNTENPMDPTVAALLTAAIETYAYGAMAYVSMLPVLIEEILEQNPGTTIAVVGMYNPMKNVVIDLTVKHLGISQQLDISEYMDLLVDAVDIYGLVYCLSTGNAIYVSVPEVQTINTSDTLGLTDMMAMIGNDCAILNPNAEGHNYIRGRIFEELQMRKPEAYRVYGRSRYFTALEIADTMLGISGAEKFANMVVAYGANFPDALTGAYLANQKGAPILLVDKGYEKMVAEYIAANMEADGTIYILGDKKAVSEEIEATLAAVGKVQRVAGSSRYKTNLEILKEANAVTGELVVVTADTPWDSLSASGANCPILLVGKTLRDDQKTYLGGTSFSRITIIGDEAAVGKSMEAELAAFCGDINRVGAKGRYRTSVAVAEYFCGNYNENVVLAFGQKFPDGLCGGPLAAMLGAPVVLAEDARADIDHYIKRAHIGIVLGGEGDGGSQITDAEAVQIFELFSAKDIVENPFAK